MKISYERFERILDKVKQQDDNLAKYYHAFSQEAIDDLSIANQELLEVLMELCDDEKKWIDYWVWELDYGTRYKPGYVTEDGGKLQVPLETKQDLWNLLEKNYTIKKILLYKEKTGLNNLDEVFKKQFNINTLEEPKKEQPENQEPAYYTLYKYKEKTGLDWGVHGQSDGVDYYKFNGRKFIKNVVHGVLIFDDLNLSRMGLNSLKELPWVQEGLKYKVRGDFDCSRNNLTTLEGSPIGVGGNFDCSRNNLTILEGGPISVGGNFDCSVNKLTSLEGGPRSVGRDFNCAHNYITNLKGFPISVGGNFRCHSNKAKFTEDCIRDVCDVDENVYCS